MTTVEYLAGAELPSVPIVWLDTSDNVIDFSTGWTFTLKVGVAGLPAVLTKTDGIAGANPVPTKESGAPNVTITWDAGELDDLTPRAWTCQLQAHNTATDKDRIRSFLLQIVEGVA